ncbi:hypothetical protein L6452_09513 [Arctium lappa]|uniref:Uncharacterized protein n=1 Tax=Arctium lappa TaxID=4217 RepID=A0ACB9DKW3_ARCLA|nr:hypothetical protein L6452_09513 [Arctium lappa]
MNLSCSTRIDEMYQVNVILDNLPVIRYTKRDSFLARWTCYPLGIKVQDSYYVFNHLNFTVLVHKYEETNVASVMGNGNAAEVIPSVRKPGSDVPSYIVVGFEVTSCSFQHHVESLKNLKTNDKYPSKIVCETTIVTMAVKENEPVAFSYELEDLSLGRLIEGYVVDNETTMNSYIGSALIGMYAKCGDLVSAWRIFDEMSKKDLVTWKLECYDYGARLHPPSFGLYHNFHAAGGDDTGSASFVGDRFDFSD